jgi:hypothetical protein
MFFRHGNGTHELNTRVPGQVKGLRWLITSVKVQQQLIIPSVDHPRFDTEPGTNSSHSTTSPRECQPIDDRRR